MKFPEQYRVEWQSHFVHKKSKAGDPHGYFLVPARDASECVVQFHPAKADYVNVHPGVLHLWRCKTAGFPNHYRQSNSKTLSIVNQIRDPNYITPHIRRGHYRILRSEVFKKKRFQVIFIHETFVKGKAQTIEYVGPYHEE